jgi:hypothetical protein
MTAPEAFVMQVCCLTLLTQAGYNYTQALPKQAARSGKIEGFDEIDLID